MARLPRSLPRSHCRPPPTAGSSTVLGSAAITTSISERTPALRSCTDVCAPPRTTVCDTGYRPQTLFLVPTWRACLTGALDQAVAKVDRPALTAYHAAKHRGGARGTARLASRGTEPIATRTRKRRDGDTLRTPPRRLPLGSLRVFVAVAEHLISRAPAKRSASPRRRELANPRARGISQPAAVSTQRPRRRAHDRRSRIVAAHAAGARRPRARARGTRGDRSGGPLRVTMLVRSCRTGCCRAYPAAYRVSAHRPPGAYLRRHASISCRDDQHAAIRLGTGEWPGVTGEKLLDEWLVPVCTPELYAKYGPLKRREDIGRYPLVHSTSEPWTAWLLEGKAMEDTTSPFTGARIDDSAAVVRLALQGFGLALVRWSLAGDDIAAGRLVVASDKPLSFFRTRTGCCIRNMAASIPRSRNSATGSWPRWLSSRARRGADVTARLRAGIARAAGNAPSARRRRSTTATRRARPATRCGRPDRRFPSPRPRPCHRWAPGIGRTSGRDRSVCGPRCSRPRRRARQRRNRRALHVGETAADQARRPANARARAAVRLPLSGDPKHTTRPSRGGMAFSSIAQINTPPGYGRRVHGVAGHVSRTPRGSLRSRPATP